jgi:H+-transporting ATPase
MSLTTDNVRPSPTPNAWRIGSLTMAGVVMGICLLAFCSASWLSANLKWDTWTSKRSGRSPLSLWCSASQATIYAIRQRRHLWGSRPSFWLAVSSVADHSDRLDIGRRLELQ